MQYHIPAGYAACRFRFGGVALDHEASFTIHANGGGLDAEEISEVCEFAFLQEISLIGASLGQSYTFTGVDVALYSEDPDPVIFESETIQPGTSVSPVVPPNCSLLVAKVTNLGGRRNRGRIYAPAGLMAEDQISDGGIISPAALTQWSQRWIDFHVELTNGLVLPALCHQYDPDLGQTPVFPTGVATFAVSSRIATQRRRLR